MNNVKASAYVKNGRLVILGLAQLKVGPVPFTYDCPVPEGTPEGPLDINAQGNEALEECLAKAENVIHQKIQHGALKIRAENLVLRSRNGDQNAIAMIIAIRKNAKQGNQKAIVGMRAIMQYIEDHPPTKTCTFAGESQHEVITALANHVENDNPEHYSLAVNTYLPHTSPQCAAILIANGPLVSNDLLKFVSSNFSERELNQFKQGLAGEVSAARCNIMGNIFRKAREIQAIRRGQFQFLDPVVRFELGV